MITLRRNVLIFHQAALGDFVLTWPIALACARLWPTNRILYVTHAGKGALAERAIGTEFRDGEPLHPLFSPDAKLPEPAMKLLNGAATIISFVSNGSDAWADNVGRRAPEAQLICVNARPEGSIDQHIMTYHAGQFGANVQLQAAIGQMITHIAASGATARRAPGAQIVLHPGSGGADKCWPMERFVELAQALSAEKHDVHIVLGEVERERWSNEQKQQLAAVGTLHHPADLVALFNLLQPAKLYVGNDSGPTHLAAISGVPTLALFGRDNEITWRPVGPNVRLLKQVPIEELPLEPVVAMVREMLAGAASTVSADVAADED
jgi:hypothetical protein